MYGIVNKVISDYIITNHGIETWQAVKTDAAVEIENFVLNEIYPDEVTFSLLESTAKILDLSMRDLSLILGKHWVLGADLVNAKLYMCSGAPDLKTFLQLLPVLHSRVMLVYPKAKAPEFRSTVIADDVLVVDYFSERTGFEDYLEGLLMGLAEYYGERIDIKLLGSHVSDHDAVRNHSVFEVRWAK